MIPNFFSRISKEFTEPIRSRTKLILVITAVIFIPALCAEVALTTLVQHNTDDILMPACEARTESGRNYIMAMKEHVKMLERYLERIEQRQMNRRHTYSLLRYLYPELSPKKQVIPVLAALRKPLHEQEEACAEIRAAGEALSEFWLSSERTSDVQVLNFSPEGLSEELLQDVNDALDESNEAVNEYDKNRTVYNAEKVCRANRNTIMLLYLIRFDYENFISQEKLRQFRADMEWTIAYNDSLLQKTVTAEEGRRLLTYSKSEHRRIGILQAILDNDMQTARKLLRTAIEESYRKEEEAWK